MPAPNVVETTTRNPNVASLTKPLSLLNLPTPVIVGNLQLMLSDTRYDYELSQDLIKGFSYGFRIPFCGTLDHAYQPRNHPSVFKEEMKLSLAHLCMCYYYISIHNNREIYVQNA